MPLTSPYYWINKFGRNPDVDSGNTADVWDYGGTGNAPDYPWPTAAAETTIVSDSVNDTAAGTGARTVHVQGVDADYKILEETATLNGTSAVTLAGQFLRIFRARVATAGSGETNAGNVDVKHGATVLARITAGYGQTLMALYTTPAKRAMYLTSWQCNVRMPNAGAISCRLDVRPQGGAWNCKETYEVGGQTGADFRRRWAHGMRVAPMSDIRVRVFGGTDNNSVVSAGFDMATLVGPSY